MLDSVCRDDSLVLFFSGTITSKEAARITSEADEIIRNSSFKTLTGNLKGLEYISSAGLRMLLHIAKENPGFSLIEASPEVYEILRVSGFTQILPVERALREISTDNAELVGRGYFSEVYRLDDETIVKKFIRDTSLADIEKECDSAKKAFICGLPCAITYDIVRADESYGLVFEALNAGTLLEELRKNPLELDSIIEKYTDVLKKIHSTPADRDTFPDAVEKWLYKLSFIRDELTADEYEKMHILLSGVSAGGNFVHSDCHLGNIMRSGDEYFIIDMETLAVGNPVFEFAPIFCSYVLFGYLPNNAEEFFGISSETAHRLFYDTFRLYFKDLSEKDYSENLEKVKLLASFHMLFWIKDNMPQNRDFFDHCYGLFRESLAGADNLNLVF